MTDVSPTGPGSRAPHEADKSSSPKASIPNASFAPGPWRACRNGECSCGQIWSIPADTPIATVTSGEWGDTYPALRFAEDGRYVEAYTARLDYGRVDPECAKATARLIAAAPKLFEALDVLLNSLDAEDVRRLGLEQEVLAASCALASAIEAQRAETVQHGSVHESATEGDAR